MNAVVRQVTIFAEISAERARQNAKWGEQNHPNGTGPTRDLLPRYVMAGSYEELADFAKATTDRNAERGTGTFADILLEEVFEALAEESPEKLRAELVQVAAVAAQWIEAIDRKAASA